MVCSIDSDKGHKYLAMLFLPTNELNKMISLNISKIMVNVAKYYDWLEVNDNTPIDIKLLVMDQCMFMSLLYDIETWGDISSFEDQIRKIELDVLK